MAWCCRARASIAGPRANRDAVECGIETPTNAERIELNALARKAQDELGRLHGPEVVLETLDGPTSYRAGDRVVIRETIRDAGLHNGSVATVQRVQGSVLFVERRDGQTVPIDTRQFPACSTATRTPNTASKVRPATPSCTSSISTSTSAASSSA